MGGVCVLWNILIGDLTGTWYSGVQHKLSQASILPQQDALAHKPREVVSWSIQEEVAKGRLREAEFKRVKHSVSPLGIHESLRYFPKEQTPIWMHE